MKDLTFLSFASYTGADTEEKDLGEILESSLFRTELGSFLFEKEFVPLVRGRPEPQFYTDGRPW